MDVVRLDNTYKPDSLVEGYSSMIWTERQLENGEFEMKTSKIDETINHLPEESMISLLDSDEVMFVENHSIAVNEDGIPELTTTGRTYETFGENRALVGEVYKEPWLALQQYTTAEIVALHLWNNLANGTGQDASRDATTLDPNNRVPQLAITDSAILTETPQNWWIEEGEVYQTVKDLLGLNSALGIRVIRPSGTTGNVISFDVSNTATRGTPQRVSTPDMSSLRIDVYTGQDRTRYQTTREPVIFHYASGHIDNPSYLFSSKDLKNMVTISSSIGSVNVDANGLFDPSYSGLDRRVLYFDGGDIGDQVYEDFLESIVQKGLIELKKHNRQVLFDGAISPISPYKYNTDYFLGDKVTLMAQYGFESTMMVTEYVRTEDQDGDRGYPTLILAS